MRPPRGGGHTNGKMAPFDPTYCHICGHESITAPLPGDLHRASELSSTQCSRPLSNDQSWHSRRKLSLWDQCPDLKELQLWESHAKLGNSGKRLPLSEPVFSLKTGTATPSSRGCCEDQRPQCQDLTEEQWMPLLGYVVGGAPTQGH